MGQAETVLEETNRFHAKLPQLIEQGLKGKWVVFKEDEVKEVFDDPDTALEYAVAKFGVSGGYVIAPVVSIDPTPLTAGVVFWLH